ncbi:putative signaling protein [Actinoplanes sp. SE50]|uniref:GGDEF domain-containing protein n=1 Tax=unclassified Actinoplanes TaxID=2626549 RepID=UPI00023ED231|nr:MULTISPECIES: GGDEF domain-containing protein [unclassified Actinoplanes]AEV84407.1 putative signaling protein [Actinoplanes sp. SE50/110]ATO82799.1 putative signaling protein [Actinoplanes sp. SE50]SLM00207.1 putative signaling protein [Actinoplanes sp. SE50/110]
MNAVRTVCLVVLADLLLILSGPLLPVIMPLHAAVLGVLLIRLCSEVAQALRDPVTGISVRRVAERHLDRARGEVTVALIDGDDLHGVNRRFGHAGGDALLAALAVRLQQAAERGDVVARLGGDEFVLISRRPVDTVRRQLTAVLATPVVLSGHPVPVRFSAGICRVPGGDHRRALTHADRLMYAAKHQGGGIVTDRCPDNTDHHQY